MQCACVCDNNKLFTFTTPYLDLQHIRTPSINPTSYKFSMYSTVHPLGQKVFRNPRKLYHVVIQCSEKAWLHITIKFEHWRTHNKKASHIRYFFICTVKTSFTVTFDHFPCPCPLVRGYILHALWIMLCTAGSTSAQLRVQLVSPTWPHSISLFHFFH